MTSTFYSPGAKLGGRLWGLLALGLAGLRPVQAQHWQRDSVLSQVLVKQLVNDATDFLWVGTEAGVWRADGYTLTPLADLLPPAAAPLPRGLIRGLATDPVGTLWIGGEVGLYQYAPRTRQLRPVQLPGSTTRQPEVYGLWQLPMAGGLWVSCGRW